MKQENSPLKKQAKKERWFLKLRWRLLFYILLTFVPAFTFPVFLYKFVYEGAFESIQNNAAQSFVKVNKGLEMARLSAEKILVQHIISNVDSFAEQVRLVIEIKDLDDKEVQTSPLLAELFNDFYAGPSSRILLFKHVDKQGQGRVMIDGLTGPGTTLDEALPDAALLAIKKNYSEHVKKSRNDPALAGQSKSVVQLLENQEKEEFQPKKLVLLVPAGNTDYSLALSVDVAGPTMQILSTVSDSLDDVAQINYQLQNESQNASGLAEKLLYIFAVIAVIMVFLLTLQGKREISDPIDHLRITAEYIRRGEYHRRTNVPPSSTSLYELGSSINRMLDSMTNLIQSEESKIQLQRNIIQLLDIVSVASKGDFTQRANVTTDILGSVADAFNMMLDEMSKLIIEVRRSGLRMSAASEQVLDNFHTITKGSKRQQMEIHSVSSKTLEVARDMQRVNLSADFASNEAEKATLTARQGSRVISETLSNMNRIRTNVQTTAKAIKSLGDRSLEVNTIVEMISDISDRTNILSLNAAIEAGKAGEQGKGFAVVADEIRKLAERTTNATKEISLFIEDIQVETKDAVLSMEEVVQEVEKGWRQTEEAGTTLQEIDRVIFDAADKIKEISESARKHVGQMDRVVGEIQSIYQVSRENMENIKRSRRIINGLEAPAKKLNQGLRVFKLQEKFLEDTDFQFFTSTSGSTSTQIETIDKSNPSDTSVAGTPVFPGTPKNTPQLNHNPGESAVFDSSNFLLDENDTDKTTKIATGPHKYSSVDDFAATLQIEDPPMQAPEDDSSIEKEPDMLLGFNKIESETPSLTGDTGKMKVLPKSEDTTEIPTNFDSKEGSR